MLSLSCQPTPVWCLSEFSDRLFPEAVATTPPLSPKSPAWHVLGQQPHGFSNNTGLPGNCQLQPAHPELPSVAVIQLQDVTICRAVGEGRGPPGQGGAVITGAALLQLQQGYRWHCDRGHSGQHAEPSFRPQTTPSKPRGTWAPRKEVLLSVCPPRAPGLCCTPSDLGRVHTVVTRVGSDGRRRAGNQVRVSNSHVGWERRCSAWLRFNAPQRPVCNITLIVWVPSRLRPFVFPDERHMQPLYFK